jgi:hypothetical protein
MTRQWSETLDLEAADAQLREYPHYDVGPLSGWPRYCARCGAEVIVERRLTGRHDPHNGSPVKQERRSCPNKRWRFDGHERTWWQTMTYIARGA